MTYRAPVAAPRGAVPPARRGRELGLFCRVCGGIYPLHARRHAGKPVYGKDHVASTCTWEGEEFTPGADWWEPAVEVLPAAEPVEPAP